MKKVPLLCNACGKVMKPHCKPNRCSWLFCTYCSITRDIRTGREIGVLGEGRK